MSGTSRGLLPVGIFELELTSTWDLAQSFPLRYEEVDVLLRCHHTPVGVVRIKTHNGLLRAEDIETALQTHAPIRDRVQKLTQRRFLLKHHSQQHTLPTWSLIICTRDRSDDLARCLKTLMQVEGIRSGEVIIVDNAPSNDQTHNLVSRFPFRYIRTARPGLNWARDAGARAATGEVLLYTDDDTVVDRYWLHSLLERFDSPRVGAVTGLTLPFELETEAQHQFKKYGGHDRGFEERCFDRNTLNPAAAGRAGSGANMAFRRNLALEMNLFGVELDGGTAALSGGDTYAFYRVLAAGYQIRYTPGALVWHRDRRDMSALRHMLYGYSVGVFAFLSRLLCVHRETDALLIGWSWLRKHHIKQTLRGLLRRPHAIPLSLLLAEWKGVAVGPFAYLRTRRQEHGKIGNNV